MVPTAEQQSDQEAQRARMLYEQMRDSANANQEAWLAAQAAKNRTEARD